MKFKIPAYYLLLQRSLLDVADLDRKVGIKEARILLGCSYHIPKFFQRIILEDMESYGLISLLGNFNHMQVKVINIEQCKKIEISAI